MTDERTNEEFADHFNFLIVDDYDFMQHLVKETLNSAGAGQIEKSSNGVEAIEMLKKMRKVDFVITDFNMPKMNGLALLKAIRTGEAFVERDTPVIMLSGFDDDALLGAAMELDASGFIHKPVSKSELVSRMNKIFMGESVIKDADEYRKVELPLVDGVLYDTETTLDETSSDTKIPSQIKAQAQSLFLENVTKGSLLAEDIVTTNGIVLITEGIEVTDKILDFLIQTKEITGISTISVLPAKSDIYIN